MRFLVALSFAILLCLQQAQAMERGVQACCHDDCLAMPACLMAGCSACGLPALPTTTAPRGAPAVTAAPAPARHPVPAGVTPVDIWRPPR